MPTLLDLDNKWIFGDVKCVINVSTSSPVQLVEEYKKRGIEYHFLPLREEIPDLGWGNYKRAVACLLSQIKKGVATIVHCDGGNHRSPMVVEGAYFALTGEHLADEYKGSKNHLLYDLENNHFPLNVQDALSEIGKLSAASYIGIEDVATLYLMIGIPASGKTSFCRSHAFLRDAISLDVVKTRARERRLIDDSLSRHRSIAIDNTNVTRDERAAYVAVVKEHGYRVVGYYFKSVIAECLERNRNREPRVPDVAILAKGKQLELPSYDEGFDELWYVSQCDGDFIVTKWED